MQMSVIDRVVAVPSYDSLPLRIELSPSRIKAVGMGLLSIPVLLALVLPFALILGLAVIDPAALPALGADPITGVQLALGFVMGAAIVSLPVRALVLRLHHGQTLLIDERHIRVEERGLFGTKNWDAPLDSFSGVADHIRASLSGTRHEVILVHPVPDKSVLLAASDRPGMVKAEAIAALLRLPQVPAADLYRRRSAVADRPMLEAA